MDKKAAVEFLGNLSPQIGVIAGLFPASDVETQEFITNLRAGVESLKEKAEGLPEEVPA